MPRRNGVRLPTAPSASMALASSILIALAVLAPNGAAAKRSEQTAATETASAPAAAATPTVEAKAAAKAERVAQREARKAQRSAAAGEQGAAAPAAAGPGSSPSGAEARQAARAARRAEREARKHGSVTTTTAAARSGASTSAATGAKAGKSHTEIQREREREREQRRREREANGGRLKESHKQREAREAREAEEAEGREVEIAIGGSGSARQALAAGGVSSVAGGSPTAQAPSTAAVAGTRVGRAVHAKHAARSSGQGSAAAPAAIATVLGLAATPAAASGEDGGAGVGAGSSHRDRASGARKSESPIVRTVTQIVGVIPTALWILIGLLALAAAAFAVTSRVAARRAKRLDRQRKALLEDVGLLQAALLPELPARLGPVGTSAAYRPASGPGAGGDFYDVFALPEGLLGVIVGDVSGHGRDALPHTTLLRYTLRAYMEAGLTPREALRAAAPALERQLGGSFATVVLASYDPRARRLTYSCAGHPHPVLTGLDPDEAIIAASAPPIGAGNATGSRQTVVSVPGAGTACFYTDGVIEARADGKLYGSRRLARALGALRGEHESERAAPLLASELLDRVAAETDRRPDDMAACLLEISGEKEAPSIVDEELVLDSREAGGKRARRFLEAAGIAEPELTASLERARTIAAEHGSALMKIDLGGERPRVSVMQDNVAPLRARALARTQEVAL